MQKIILIGYVGKEPETRNIPGVEQKVVNISLATSEKYKDRSGNQVESTEWFNLELWGNHAEIAEKYVTKGTLLYVEGKIKTEHWEKDGQKFQRIKVRVSNLIMLGGKSIPEDQKHKTKLHGNITTNDTRAVYQTSQPIQEYQENEDDGLPF